MYTKSKETGCDATMKKKLDDHRRKTTTKPVETSTNTTEVCLPLEEPGCPSKEQYPQL